MRRRLATLALAAAVPVLLAGCQSPAASKAFNEVNTARTTNGVAALRTHDALVTKAEAWARHLLANSNNQCSSTTLVHSVLSDGKPTGAKALAENVGCAIVRGSADNGITIIQNGFMGSTGHRTNILNPIYNRGAVGYVSKVLPNGTFLVYEVQEFAQV